MMSSIVRGRSAKTTQTATVMQACVGGAPVAFLASDAVLKPLDKSCRQRISRERYSNLQLLPLARFWQHWKPVQGWLGQAG